MARLALVLILPVFVSGCLATAAVGAAGKVAGSAIRATGEVVGAGINAAAGGRDKHQKKDADEDEGDEARGDQRQQEAR